MTSYKHGPVSRATGAVVLSLLVGALLPSSFQVGYQFVVASPQDSSTWGLLFWGEHWVIRPVASAFATLGAAFVAGAVARSRGSLLAVVAAVPSVLLWAYAALAGWMGHAPFVSGGAELDLSIGNKLAATLTALAMGPLAAVGGEAGEDWGKAMSQHFDSRPRALFGVMWYHYLWAPVLLHLVVAQSTWAAVYGFGWLKASWRAGFNPYASIVPSLFLMAIVGTIALTWVGISRAYWALADIDHYESAWSRAGAVLWNGVGFPVAAVVLQVLIQFAHGGLVKLLA